MRLLAALAALLCAALPAVPAWADGDPASDTLIVVRLFEPYQVKLPQQSRTELQKTIAEAKAKGFPVRVALIGDNFDLGSAALLYRKPQVYAKFLAQELAQFNTDWLLVVMPNGYGVYHCKGIKRADGHVDPCELTYPLAADQKALRGVPAPEKSGQDLAAAATAALRAVGPGHGANLSGSRTKLLIAGALLIIFAAACITLLWRRSHGDPTPKERNRMIRFTGIATAGLAIAMLASSAATAAAADGSADQQDPTEAAISAYQRAYPKITLDAATRAAGQQDQRKAIYDSLLAKDGTTFGGAWFDPVAGVLHIASTDKATAARAQELGKANDIQVEPLLVKRSYDTLVAQANALRSPETALGKAARGQVGVEVQSNTVIAAVPASQVAELAKSAPEGVRVVADPGVKTEADSGCTARTACDWTIRAGSDLWTGSAGNNVCSVGFTARDASNQRFVYTAGHCSGGNGITWGTGGQTIGPMQSSINTSFLDASIIRVTNSWFTSDTGGEIYNEFFPGRSVNVNGVAPNLGYIWTGDFVCLAANFTQPNGANFCGVVGSAMDFSVRGMVRVDGFDACPGDSGGGWYWLTNSGRRIAYGMHSRSDTGCHGDQGGSHSWFSALPLVKAFFTPGLNVELRP